MPKPAHVPPAKPIQGTKGNDNLLGTPDADKINAKGGNDIITEIPAMTISTAERASTRPFSPAISPITHWPSMDRATARTATDRDHARSTSR